MTESSLHSQTARLPLRAALPFWLSLLMIPLVLSGAIIGGPWVLVPILATWGVFATLDAALGLNTDNMDAQTKDSALVWHRAITLVWPPLQFLMIFGLIWYIPRAGHLGALEIYLITVGMGILSGSVGIVYAHELMHQRNRLERRLICWAERVAVREPMFETAKESRNSLKSDTGPTTGRNAIPSFVSCG